MTEQVIPVVAAPVWEAVPPELASMQQWLLWKFEFKDAEAVKPGKIPYYVSGGRRTGGQGDDRDRSRLATLPVVRRAFERGGWHGIGFGFLPDDGLIGIDIDGAIDPATGEVTQRCADIIKACASFTEYSPSGKGVHIIVKGKTDTNKSNDIGLEVFCSRQFFTFTANIYPDTPAEVNAIDARVLARLHATIDEAKNKRKVVPLRAAAAPVASAQRLGDGVDHFKEVNKRAMAGMDAWVTVLFPKARPHNGGYRVTSKDLGRQLQEDLSLHPDGIQDFGLEQGFTPIDLVMKWLPASAPKDALHWLAQRLGVDLAPVRNIQQKKNRDVSAPAGGGGSDGGEPPDDVPPDGDEDGGVYDALVRHRGKPVDCRENVMYCLRLDPDLKGLVKKNEFSQLIERSRMTPWGHPAGDWDEEDDLMLGEFLLAKHGLGIKAKSNLRDGVLMAARSLKYNPVIDLINSEPWDGIIRLEHWLSDAFEVDDRPYTRLIGKFFMMGLVNRAIRPGCKFDTMLILKGEQGLQKSSAFRALADPFFTDNAIRMGDKDSLMAMQLVWIAESAELESLNKSETTQIKQFLSAQEDLYRPPYGAQLVKKPRHAVNVGTTNADTFLKDATGDRRFWPLEVFTVNLDVIRNNRLQWLAEALHRLKAGERYWLTTQEDKQLLVPEQEQFKRVDTWEDLIDAYVNQDTLAKTDNALLTVNAKRDFFTTIEIYDKALNIKADRMDGNGQMDTRIGNAMTALGFKRHRQTTGKRQRGFKRGPAGSASPVGDAEPAEPEIQPKKAGPADYDPF